MLNGLVNIDTSTYLWINRLQHKSLVKKISRFASFSGDGYLYALIAVLLLAFDVTDNMLFIQAGLIAFLLELPAITLLKAIIRRDRPFVQIPDTLFAIQPSDQFSMPSGHTAAAFLMASITSTVYPAFALGAYIWASLIGISRVVLGVHYPGDVLAGALLGLTCAFASLAVLL